MVIIYLVMKYFLLLILILPLQLFSQEEYIEMTNEGGKTIIIKQDKRIKIVTEDGQRYFGRVSIIDAEHVVMRKDTITLSSIAKIQKRSSLKSALSAVIIVASSLAIPAGAAYIFVDSSLAGAISGSGLVGLPIGIVLPVVGKNYNKKHWKFTIVSQ